MQIVQSPNHFSGRAGQQPRWIILHGTAGFESPQECAAYFGSTTSQVSAHYIVGRDGTVIQCVSEADGAWANGGVTGSPATLGFRTEGDGVHRDSWWSPEINPNYQCISIEHIKPSTDNSDFLTPQQATASFSLIKDICGRWGIPMQFADSSGGITGHFSMDALNRSRCPGPYPWDELWGYLNAKETTMAGVPQGWSDSNGTLTAPNGVAVVMGFRNWVLNHQWDPANTPQGPEIHVSQVQLHNTALGPGQIQVFRDDILWWTPNLGVIQEPYLGLEVGAAYKKIDDQARQIADLQAKLQQSQATSLTQPQVESMVSVIQGIATAAQNVLHGIGKA